MVIKTSFKNKVDTSNKEINDRYGSLVETSPNGIAIISKMGVVTFCNPTFLKLTGYSEREIIGKHITKLPTLRKKDIPKYLKMFIASIKGTKNPETEFIFKTKSGELRFGKANMSLIKRGGKVIEMMVILRDITAEKKAELAFKKAQEVAQVGHWELDLIDNKLTWSDEIYRIFEIDPKKFGASYEAFLDMIHPDDRDFVDKAYAGSVKNKKSYDIVHRLLFRDGKIKYVNERCQTEYDENGKPICSLGTVQDITEEKKAQEALIESDKKYRDMVENLPEIIVELDSEGKITFANNRAFSQTGYNRNDFNEGLNIFQMVDQRDQIKIRKNFTKILEGKNIGRQLYTIKRKDKTTFTAFVDTSIVKNIKGVITGFRVIVFDITEQINIENKLRESEKRLLEAQNIANLGYFELNVRTNKIFMSDELLRICKLPKDFDIDFTFITKLFHPEDRAFVIESIERSIKNKSLMDIEHRLILNDKEKSIINARIRAKAYYDKSGKPERFMGTAQDITDRKKAEKELENSENRFKRLSQSSKEGIVFHDKGKVIDANRAATKMIGIKLSDYIGMNALDFLTPDSKKIAEKKMRMGNEQPYEVQLEKTNGKILDVEVIGKGIYINGRKARVTVIRDITDRKKAEKELEDSENRFKRLSESANEGIIFHDDGILLDANQAAAKMMDVKLSDTIGMNALDFLTPDSKKIAKEKMRMGYEQPYEAQIQKPNGKKLDVELIGKSAYFNNKKVRVVIIRDITERKKSEIELKKSHHKTEKALSGTIKTLATIVETRDPYTSGHQKRVAKLARAISLELGMDKDKIKTIHTAALIHDIGKINVPASILAKPGKISDLEYNMIKTHSFDGYKILKKIEFQWPLAKIVLQHHERENGSGFPEGLKNKKIMLEAKIIAVADVVEAMSSHRPYRPALGIDKALKEIKKGKGKLYDTKVVEACVKIITKNGFKF